MLDSDSEIVAEAIGVDPLIADILKFGLDRSKIVVNDKATIRMTRNDMLHNRPKINISPYVLEYMNKVKSIDIDCTILLFVFNRYVRSMKIEYMMADCKLFDMVRFTKLLKSCNDRKCFTASCFVNLSCGSIGNVSFDELESMLKYPHQMTVSEYKEHLERLKFKLETYTRPIQESIVSLITLNYSRLKLSWMSEYHEGS